MNAIALPTHNIPLYAPKSSEQPPTLDELATEVSSLRSAVVVLLVLGLLDAAFLLFGPR